MFGMWEIIEDHADGAAGRESGEQGSDIGGHQGRGVQSCHCGDRWIAAPLNVPGIGHPMVCGALEVLRGEADVCERTLIVGGGMVGIETALAVADRCKQVTLIEMTDEAMANLTPDEQTIYSERLKKDGALLVTGKRLVGISDKGAIVADRFGREEEIPCTAWCWLSGFDPRGDSSTASPGRRASRFLKSAIVSHQEGSSMRSTRDSG